MKKETPFPFNLDFFEMFVHELKSPLSVLQYQINALEKNESTDQIQKTLSQVIQFIDDSLHLKEVESHHKFKFEWSSWNRLLNNSLDRLSSRMKFFNVQIEEDPLEEDLLVYVDSRWMGLCLSQLILNSLEHSPHQGKVFLNTQIQNNHLLFSVTDEGKGLPEEIKPEEIFKKFKKFRPSGTGLGLFIAQSIVQAHGGNIQVESKKNQGCRFFFSLPHVKAIKKAS